MIRIAQQVHRIACYHILIARTLLLPQQPAFHDASLAEKKVVLYST